MSPSDNAAFRAIERSIQRVYPGTVAVPGLMMAGTDSRHYMDVADDAYRFAGLRIHASQTALFHGKDEHIRIDTLGPMVQFHVDLIRNGLGTGD